MRLTPEVVAAATYSFNTLFNSAYASSTNAWYRQLATEVTSTGPGNRYTWATNFGGLREWLGERKVRNLAAKATTIDNKNYERTVEIDANDFEDNNLGVHTPAIQALGDAAATWPNKHIARLIRNGGTLLAYDGQPFFHASHPKEDGSGGTYANLITSRALTADNYLATWADLMSMTMAGDGTDDAEGLGLNPNLLIVPPQLAGMAKTITESETINGDTNINRGTAKVLVLAELAADATSWYLADTSKPIKPFVVQNRTGPRMVAKTAPADDNVFWHRKLVWGVDLRGAVGFTFPFLIAKVTA